VYDKDAEHLRLLGIMSWVIAGINLLCGGFSLIYVGIGAAMVSGAIPMPSPSSTSAPGAPGLEMAGWIYIVMGGVYVAFFGILVIGNILAGNYLRAARNRTFCIVVAAMNCLNMPLGTILGVFTLVVVLRESVAERFRRELPAV
jgi:hypothetical protein